MTRRARPHRPASVTSVPESPAQELARRQRRYAAGAAIFIATFTAAAVVHRHTALALVLCAIAMATLVLSVIGANVRSPRRTSGHRPVRNDQQQLPPGRE